MRAVTVATVGAFPTVGSYRSKEPTVRKTLTVAARLVRRWSSRTVMKKYRLERNGRRSFDTAVEYPTVEPTATEKTRTAKSGGPRYAYFSGYILDGAIGSCNSLGAESWAISTSGEAQQ